MHDYRLSTNIKIMASIWKYVYLGEIDCILHYIFLFVLGWYVK